MVTLACSWARFSLKKNTETGRGQLIIYVNKTAKYFIKTQRKIYIILQLLILTCEGNFWNNQIVKYESDTEFFFYSLLETGLTTKVDPN